MERELGFSVFDRSRNGCTTTESGRILCDGIAPLYREIQQVIDRARENSRPKKLRVCQATGIVYPYIEQLLLEFLHQNPDVILERVIAEPCAWHALTLENKADLFIAPGTEAVFALWKKEGLQIIDFGPGSLLCVTSPRHPLAAQESVTLEDLKPYPVYTEENMLCCSGLEERASSVGLQIRADPAAFVRYKMMDYCKEGCVFLHAGSLKNEMIPLNCIPVEDFSFRNAVVMRNSMDTTMQLIHQFITEWIRSRQP